MYPRLIVSALLDEEQCRPYTTPREREAAAAFGNPRRRREWLTWRAVVRRELGDVELDYDAQGAPFVHRSPIYISVSHCRDAVAVLFSTRRCAVDVESLDRRFGRVRERYLSDGEEPLCRLPHFEAVAWSAKETLYKFAGREGLDFRDDLRILEADASRGRLLCSVAGGEPVVLHYLLFDGWVAVWM